MIAPARRAAFEVVRRVFEEDAYADRALASAVEGLDERDRALAQRLAYGTVQRTRTIDFGIEQAGKRPVRKLDPPVRAALRVGAYQLAWTDQAVHAVVDDAVELVRAAKRERAVPFTNAVMRRLSQSFNGLVASLPEGPVKHSYPDWIFDVWRRDLGLDDALSLMRAQNEPPQLEVLADEPVGEPTDVPGAYVVERVDTAHMRPMSRASQLAALVVGSRPGERVLDGCAAPGGKSLILQGEVTAVELHPGRAEAMAKRMPSNVRVVTADLRELDESGFDRALVVGSRPGERVLDGCAAPGGKSLILQGEVTAVELHPGRAEAMAKRMPPNVRVVTADLRELDESGFDRALVDAPCSGLGVLARRPDLRWRASPLPDLQLELLRAAAARTRAGGTVVYSVCTLNADENEAVVDAAGLEIEPLGDEWPQYAHPSRPEFLLTRPDRDRTSGFFIARLRV